MPRTIIEIDVEDTAFQQFQENFDKYRANLAALPGQWQKSDSAVNSIADGFVGMTAAMMAQAKLLHDQVREQERLERLERGLAKSEMDRSKRSKQLVSDSKKIATNLASGTVQLVKWVALGGLLGAATTVASGFGIGELANGVVRSSRLARSLGVTIGEEKAANIAYSQYADVDSLMSNITAAKVSPQSQWAFATMGVNPRENTAKLLPEVLLQAKSIFDNAMATNPQTAASVAENRGLYAMGVDLPTLMALHNTDVNDLKESIKYAAAMKDALNLDAQTVKDYRGLSVTIAKAGNTIETAFIKGLMPLADGPNGGVIGELANAVSGAIGDFLGSKDVQQWVRGLGDELKNVVTYLKSADFHDKMAQFITGIDMVAREILAVAMRLKWLIPEPVSPKGDQSDVVIGSGAGVGSNGNIGSINHPTYNNPGNLRLPGSTTQFQKFASPQAGLYAMAQQLQRYEVSEKFHHADTLEKIIKIYAPPSENDTAAYIKDVAARTGFKADQHLDLLDTKTLATLVSAMAKHENHWNNYSAPTVATIINNKNVSGPVSRVAPQAVLVTIHNAAGAAVAVQANQLPQ